MSVEFEHDSNDSVTIICATNWGIEFQLNGIPLEKNEQISRNFKKCVTGVFLLEPFNLFSSICE